MTSRTSRSSLLAVLLVTAACSGDAPPADSAGGSQAAETAAGGLTAVEMEQGIGPIRDLELGPIDAELAGQGETYFATKCSACHKLEERYVGPPLGEVLDRRRPEFVMNMMMNAGEMVQRHPVIQELLAQYYTPMPPQVSDPAEARAILEYLRANQTGGQSTQDGSAGGA